eukprot:804807-Rhodomonas_salina.1
MARDYDVTLPNPFPTVKANWEEFDASGTIITTFMDAHLVWLIDVCTVLFTAIQKSSCPTSDTAAIVKAAVKPALLDAVKVKALKHVQREVRKLELNTVTPEKLSSAKPEELAELEYQTDNDDDIPSAAASTPLLSPDMLLDP